jgi:hypothetical protein
VPDTLDAVLSGQTSPFEGEGDAPVADATPAGDTTTGDTPAGDTATPTEPAAEGDTTATEPAPSEGGGDEEGATDDPADGGQEAADAAWLEETGKRYDVDLSKYNTQEDAIAGMVSAVKKVGERDQYAQLGKDLLAQYRGREAELEAILRGDTSKQAPATPTAGDAVTLPQTPEEVALLEASVERDAEGKLVPAEGAPPDAVTRLTAYHRHLQKQLKEFALDPKGFLKKHAGFDPEEQTTQFQQELAQREAVRATNDWLARHAAELWVDGDSQKGFTPLGQKAQEAYARAGGENEVERMENALYFARLEMPKATPRRTSQSARHRPNVTPAAGAKKTLTARVDEVKHDPKRRTEEYLKEIFDGDLEDED